MRQQETALQTFFQRNELVQSIVMPKSTEPNDKDHPNDAVSLSSSTPSNQDGFVERVAQRLAAETNNPHQVGTTTTRLQARIRQELQHAATVTKTTKATVPKSSSSSSFSLFQKQKPVLQPEEQDEALLRLAAADQQGKPSE